MTNAVQHGFLGAGAFAIGSVVGSFLNVCIYRIPWEKSVIWPASCCPKCLSFIEPRDNVPILGWFLLKGKCRNCGLPIAARYPLIEALVGLLFVAVYYADVVVCPPDSMGWAPPIAYARMGFHMLLVALLTAAAFIDYDMYIIPDEITVPGMVLGLALGTLFPEIRPAPGFATTHWGGLWAGLHGMLVGGLFVWSIGVFGKLLFRKDAMGFGDVTLMAMIGIFMGWQAVILTIFLGSIYGLIHALRKLFTILKKWLSRRKISSGEHELPYGPYLSLGAVTLLLAWPWLWPRWASGLFEAYSVVFWYMVGRQPNG